MTELRPFRFGVVAGIRGSARDWADAARAIEGDGYASLLAPDNLMTASPFPALAAAASATSTLHLGTWVLASPLRTPGEVVRETRTMLALAPGRFELGLGAGRPGGEQDAAALGREWGSPGRRVGLVDETAAAVAGIDDAPPIVVAGAGDRMLGIAGRHASTLALALSPTATVDDVAMLADRAHRLARPDIELTLQVTGVGDDIPRWLRGQGLTPDALRTSGAASLLSGDAERDADAIRALRERTGVSYLTLSDEFAARLAPLVEILTGT
jgi:alkanesulfonate monooxygenase SsuD/methylene tetrahydromethanopterin reductase-like flavin-dependent oxidoreductase (luciferase family)